MQVLDPGPGLEVNVTLLVNGNWECGSLQVPLLHIVKLGAGCNGCPKSSAFRSCLINLNLFAMEYRVPPGRKALQPGPMYLASCPGQYRGRKHIFRRLAKVPTGYKSKLDSLPSRKDLLPGTFLAPQMYRTNFGGVCLHYFSYCFFKKESSLLLIKRSV